MKSPRIGDRKQLAARRIRDRLKEIERILDGDKRKGIPSKESTINQKLTYLTIYQKLARLLSDGDRMKL